jgi:hypothetical protein
MMTEAKAERTCCDESDDSSCNCSKHALVRQVKEAHTNDVQQQLSPPP